MASPWDKGTLFFGCDGGGIWLERRQTCRVSDLASTWPKGCLVPAAASLVWVPAEGSGVVARALVPTLSLQGLAGLQPLCGEARGQGLRVALLCSGSDPLCPGAAPAGWGRWFPHAPAALGGPAGVLDHHQPGHRLRPLRRLQESCCAQAQPVHRGPEGAEDRHAAASQEAEARPALCSLRPCQSDRSHHQRPSRESLLRG